LHIFHVCELSSVYVAETLLFEQITIMYYLLLCSISIADAMNPRLFGDTRQQDQRQQPSSHHASKSASEKEDTDSMLTALRKQLQPHLVMALRQGSVSHGGLFPQLPQVKIIIVLNKHRSIEKHMKIQ